jgi:selenocysteine-specific elongation factor
MDLARIVPGVVCTAGHVDHGKSALVRRLTGTDPDRLKEEKERGMTTDLGFASFLLPDGRRLGLIDVPGHERFVRHMVAGATGIRGALLVVAADSGVMPQTREHLRILELLGVREGCVALTKADLADADMLELARDDVRDLVEGTFLEGAPVVAVSALTGTGVAELEGALQDLASRFAPRHEETRVFRLPVQRSFAIEGHGTVVTGVPFGGELGCGDGVEVLDSNRRARVRRITAYGEELPRVRGPHSAALNLAGIDWHEVSRGDTVSIPGCFSPSVFVEARFRLLPECVPLADREEIELYHGTRREPATLVLLDRYGVEPGTEAFVQLRLEKPGFLVPGDRYLVRRPSPSETLGGGTILACSGRKRRRKEGQCPDLAAREAALADPAAFLLCMATELGTRGLAPAEAVRETGTPRITQEARFADLEAGGKLRRLPGPVRFLDPVALEGLRRGLLNRLRKHLEENPRSEGADRKLLCDGSDAPSEVMEAALSLLAAEGIVELRGPRVVFPEATAAPASADPLEARAEALIRDWGLQPVPARVLVSGLGAPEACVEAAIGGLLRRGAIHSLGERGYVHDTSLAKAREGVLEFFRKNPGARLGFATAKELLGVSNRVANAILRHFQERENLLMEVQKLFVLKPGKRKEGRHEDRSEEPDPGKGDLGEQGEPDVPCEGEGAGGVGPVVGDDHRIAEGDGPEEG